MPTEPALSDPSCEFQPWLLPCGTALCYCLAQCTTHPPTPASPPAPPPPAQPACAAVCAAAPPPAAAAPCVTLPALRRASAPPAAPLGAAGAATPRLVPAWTLGRGSASGCRAPQTTVGSGQETKGRQVSSGLPQSQANFSGSSAGEGQQCIASVRRQPRRAAAPTAAGHATPPHAHTSLRLQSALRCSGRSF